MEDFIDYIKFAIFVTITFLFLLLLIRTGSYFAGKIVCEERAQAINNYVKLNDGAPDAWVPMQNWRAEEKKND